MTMFARHEDGSPTKVDRPWHPALAGLIFQTDTTSNR